MPYFIESKNRLLRVTDDLFTGNAFDRRCHFISSSFQARPGLICYVWTRYWSFLQQRRFLFSILCYDILNSLPRSFTISGRADQQQLLISQNRVLPGKGVLPCSVYLLNLQVGRANFILFTKNAAQILLNTFRLLIQAS